MSDDGVEIEMLRRGRHLWDAYVERLGVDHSAYSHSVRCSLSDDGDLVILSKGSGGDVDETRDLNTGQLLDRSVSKYVPDR